ncbi:hypothetical protein F2P56_036919 [Juglans regia]|uniref:RING-H2 finger protein ATL50 n=2 Tax=Juglans regia TaxID=51240 RepID=A0A2I4ET22_JUGRE|nr:putative RING-H2 finger protein ATL50 [Juglans regia]XP_035543745.1 putative RING-H2 finger protein ATL50 [Juglans regia]KAF5442056.1 hypothetical protein F2P56_036919 [Juglans regia]
MNILSFPTILMALASIPIAKCINITFLVDLLGHLKFKGMMALSRLCRPLNDLPDQQDHQTDQDQSTNSTYVLVINGSSPSLVPVYTLMALIKKRVPVIEYGIFVERYGSVAHEMACSVCLNSVKRSHEIRELSNCSHVFHRECLDRWVDEAQVTCPLCRTMLLPAARKDQIMMML